MKPTDSCALPLCSFSPVTTSLSISGFSHNGGTYVPVWGTPEVGRCAIHPATGDLSDTVLLRYLLKRMVAGFMDQVDHQQLALLARYAIPTLIEEVEYLRETKAGYRVGDPCPECDQPISFDDAIGFMCRQCEWRLHP